MKDFKLEESMKDINRDFKDIDIRKIFLFKDRTDLVEQLNARCEAMISNKNFFKEIMDFALQINETNVRIDAIGFKETIHFLTDYYTICENYEFRDLNEAKNSKHKLV